VVVGCGTAATVDLDDPGTPGVASGTIDGGEPPVEPGAEKEGSDAGGEAGPGKTGGPGAPGAGGFDASGAPGSAGAEGGAGGPSNGAIGAPCTQTSQCLGPGAQCTPGPGWPNGYCMIFGCQAGSCPADSDCYDVGEGETACLRNCTQRGDCRPGYACHPDAEACIPACGGPADCAAGESCDATTGLCAETAADAGAPPDAGAGPPAGPGPTCAALPSPDCVGTAAHCGQLVAFTPAQGPGYHNYPLNGETASNQYRSFARRDLVQLIKWATAYVDCKAAGWTGGNSMPLGLGDMSESNGAIPGTSIGSPGHPAGTHVNGNDMDIAYYQDRGPNNFLREICPHTTNGQDQYHCTGAPDRLDVWRTALVLGALAGHARTRIIGVDGKVGPLVAAAIQSLCVRSWLPAASCTVAEQGRITYEATNTGRGWFQFHHHHFHISLKAVTSGPTPPSLHLSPEGEDLTPALEVLNLSRTPGEARISR